ncbi:hypothetical protein MVEN_00842400 [Mycena venus]|uniref:F-box domain-containing protein n=1 Tax=Mycena venus TaxID=2733690 RepID=A0A8H7D408_9AGAR|nr:hypothetical protein MVEN_00842400 [Mycena venus]
MASPFAPRLGTNYCPTGEEVLQIEALLVEPSLRLKGLDDEIAELQKAIDKLTEERNNLSIYVDGHKALISPVRRLPLDIIEEIFVACIPTHRNCVMSASEAPVLLGRICSSWRTISLSTPRLWAKLHIVEPSRWRFGSSNALVDDKVAQRLDTMKMWLGRSGQCPLSISLQSGPDYDSPPSTPTETSGQFLQELIPFARRWQHIRLAMSPVVFKELAHLTAEDVPMLESVAVHPQHQYPSAGVPWEHFGMLSSPRICSFAATGNSFPLSLFNPQILPLCWNLLTDLTIDGPTWQSPMSSGAMLQTMSHCTQLRTCKLVINDLGNPDLSHYSPVALPFLHTLELEFGTTPGSPVSRLLDWLSLPELRDFTLHGHTIMPHYLVSFFGLCPRLESVSIDSNSFSKNSLLENLRGLPPTTRHLTIHDISHGSGDPLAASLDDKALEVLTPASGISTCCPALESLTITYCSLISDSALLGFIQGRMAIADDSEVGHTATLKRVEIQFNRRMTLDVMPSLKPFIETGGLEVLISYISSRSTQFSPWQGLVDAPSPWAYSDDW